jgi:GNAT superfamily N-acetyltransferase
MVVIRPAEPGEAELLCGLVRAAFAEYEGLLDPPSSAGRKTPVVVREELADGGALVAEVGGQAAGCVFWHRHADHLYLDRLAVLPAQRGAGVGGALVSAVEALARHEGLGRVRLSVRLALPENRAYYERRGYAVLSYGTHTGYAAPTFVTLEKRLGSPHGRA